MSSGRVPAYLDREPLFTPEQCRKIRDKIFSLKEDWLRRGKDRPSCTLFTACYLDAKGESDVSKKYLRGARKYNPVLRRHFRDMYETVFERLEQLLGEHVYPAPGLALPGFHVFIEENGIFGPDGNIHYDTFHFDLDWKRFPGADPMNAMTFTVPIVLPECGSSLEAWNMPFMEARLRAGTGGSRSLRELLEKRPCKIIRYRQGKMMWMKGFIPHRVQPMKNFRPGEERITLQGHAVKTRKGWAAYW